MGDYKINFKDILLPNWKSWDTGNSNIPAKNVTLIDGKTGSLLVDDHGATIYSGTLDELAEHDDMIVSYLTNKETSDTFDELGHLLPAVDIEEAKIVFHKYLEREDSYVSEIK
jgi:hypothetical protein